MLMEMYYGSSRSQSAGPSSVLDQYGIGPGMATTSTTTLPRRTAEAAAASHIASPITNRRLYQQQPAYLRHHKSLDGMELIGNDMDQAYWKDIGMPQHSLLNQNCANDISTSQAFGSSVSPPKLTGHALEQEYELLKRDYEVTLQKLHATMNSIKTFWSPELKKERQMRKEEAQKVLILQQKIATPYNQNDIGVAGSNTELDKLRVELNLKEQALNSLMDMNRCDPNSLAVARRIADLEAQCTHLDAALASKDEQVRAYQQKLNQVLSIGYEDTAKEAHIVELEEELKRLKVGAANRPLDFTNKSISTHELHTLKMKMEKSEMELAHRSNELSSTLAKLRAAEESNGDFSRHIQLLKDSVMAKDQQISLLHEDVDALRKKLESKNQLIEHRDVTIKNLETMLENVRSQLTDSSQAVKDSEQKLTQMNRRTDHLESTLREKEHELENAKHRLQAQPDVVFEKEMKIRLENAERDKVKLQQNIDEIRKNAECERHEQLEAFKEQTRKDRIQIESLQKELSDRQILLESQNEKIGDLDGELKRNIESGRLFKIDADKAKLQAQLEEARSEVDRLLKIVQNLEKERTMLTTKCTQLQIRTTPDGTSAEAIGTSGRATTTMKNRIDELEEALRESVSITAEREMHVAQQKQINNQLTTQLNDAVRELATLRKELHETPRNKDHEAVNRAFEKERQKHLEQLLQLKHEAIVAALGEKDAHIALLEMSPREDVRDQLDTLRKHREKLMQKLKIENERRAKLIEQINASASSPYIAPTSGVGLPAIDSTLAGTQNVNDQDDDAEGIWA
ncbi:hypothetical protein QR680_003430 [Steinernema hermaphroditum]|uniref:Uncharacterized protein n=1 Tax=Steinernema hermaphroditum TaxID=289476 RepID=A0AA39H6Q8_9BILA|nr:hypothetical protein QR680_003430 [Steinernema hermaphroditum]